ncbi:MAG: APC family permease, partial [Sphingopyxis sp.]
ALLGFESAGVAADRVQNPRRTIMRATMIGTAITGLLYIIVSSGIALTLPLADIGRSHAPFALFIATHFGASSGAIIAAFAAIAAIGALNGWVLIQGEVPLGMARTGALPGWFARVNQRDVPVGVLLASSTLASLLVLTNASQSLAGLFTFAATLTTCASLWLYLAICVGAIARRVALLPAMVGLAFSLFAMWGAGWQASGLSLLLMATGAPLYWMRGKAG